MVAPAPTVMQLLVSAKARPRFESGSPLGTRDKTRNAHVKPAMLKMMTSYCKNSQGPRAKMSGTPAGPVKGNGTYMRTKFVPSSVLVRILPMV